MFIGRTDVEAETPILWPQRADSFEKTMMLGKIEGKRRRGQQRMRWLDVTTNSMYVNLRKLADGEGQESLVCCSPWGHKASDTT